MTRRCSVLRAALLPALTLLLAVLPMARASAATITWPVYTDKIDWGLEPWSWNGNCGYANASPVAGGASSMAATFTSGWAS